MKKLLTIGLAAAALAGGVVGVSGAAQAADGNHDGYDHGRYDGGRYDRDRHDRDDWRGRGGYRHHEVCRTVWRYSPYYGRTVRTVRCY
jgi:hypothetical protein